MVTQNTTVLEHKIIKLKMMTMYFTGFHPLSEIVKYEIDKTYDIVK